MFSHFYFEGLRKIEFNIKPDNFFSSAVIEFDFPMLLVAYENIFSSANFRILFNVFIKDRVIVFFLFRKREKFCIL